MRIESVLASLTQSPRSVRKLWGYERILVNDAHYNYCGKILTVIPNGVCCSLHFHARKTETFHVLSGRLQLQIQTLRDTSRGKKKFDTHDFHKGKIIPLYTGQSITLPTYTAHRFWVDDEVCEFLEVSTFDKAEDSIRLIQAGLIPTKF